MPTKMTITTETHEVWVYRRPKKQVRGWCETCSAEVELLTADEAARLTGGSLRGIFRQIELDQLHFQEAPTGEISICLPSLLAGQPYLEMPGPAD
ncbi:MAG TPA: hypothetical protein PLK30_27210 [Blastocatellia bacterium]|nr:hypothetical protein [Blastocatellia bacterium]